MKKKKTIKLLSDKELEGIFGGGCWVLTSVYSNGKMTEKYVYMR